MKSEKSITLFESAIDLIHDMDGDTAKRFVLAIADYAFDGVEPPKTDIAVYYPWRMVKYSIDVHNELVEKRKTAGVKGGQANASKTKQNEANASKTKQNEANASKTKQNEANTSKTKQNEANTSKNNFASTCLAEKEKEKEKEIEEEKEIEIEKEIEKEQEQEETTNIRATARKPANASRVSDAQQIKNDIHTYCVDQSTNETDEPLETALLEFVKMRKTIKKPLTPYALKKALDKLDTLALDNVSKLAIVNQSIEKSWQSFYPVKHDDQKKEETAAERIKRIMGPEFFEDDTPPTSDIDMREFWRKV